MVFILSQNSLNKLATVHKDLQAVVKKAIQITDNDFCVLCGIRTVEDQKKFVAEGKSQTMDSRHLTGHAVDLGIIGANNTIDWTYSKYERLAVVMKQAAAELKIPIEWGGDWKTIKDGDHFQLPRSVYA